MALTRTTRGSASGGSSPSGGDLTTSAFTPSNNSLLVVAFGGIREDVLATDPQSTAGVSGGGWTWTKRIGVNHDPAGWTTWVTIWTAPVSTGASMQVSATNDNQMNGTWLSVVEYTGYDTGSPIGASVTNTRTATSGSWSSNLSAAPSIDSEVFAAVGADNWGTEGGVNIITVGTGWTEIHDFLDVGTETHGQTQVRGGSTSLAVLWNEVDADSDTGGGGGGLMAALEIKAAASASGVPLAWLRA